MRIFLAELRKSFIHKRGWMILLFLLVSQVLIYGFGTQSYNFQVERYREEYESYLASFGGKIDEQKEKALSEEEERIASAEEELLSLFQKMYFGECTPEEYDKGLKEYRNVYQEKISFQQIQNQYDYARQDAEHRYIIDENGWFASMQEKRLNFLLIFCVILLTVYVFSGEYETQMYGIISCTPNGKRRTAGGKIAVCLISAVMFGIITAAVCILSAFVKYGLHNGEYPLQSVQYFSACQYDLTIWQGYLLSWCFKIFALCIISIITSLCTVLLKRGVYAFFVSVLVVILPYFIFDIDFILKFIPYLGLSFGGLYFRGTEAISPETDMIQMQPIPLTELLIVLGAGFALCLICLLLTIRIWNNRPLNRRKKK